MVTISGTTHIKTILSFSPGTGEHFIGNKLHSSDKSDVQFIHILHLFMVNSVTFKPSPEESNMENEWDQRMVPVVLSNDKGTPCL